MSGRPVRSGGRRAGAGRPPLPERERLVPVSLMVAPWLRDLIRERGVTWARAVLVRCAEVDSE